MEPLRGDHEEILRLRERVHGLLNDTRALSWRLELVEGAVKGIRGDVREIREIVEEMVIADEIAQAVADKVNEEMRKRTTLLATWPRRIGAFIAGAVVLAESLKGLVHGL